MTMQLALGALAFVAVGGGFIAWEVTAFRREFAAQPATAAEGGSEEKAVRATG